LVIWIAEIAKSCKPIYYKHVLSAESFCDNCDAPSCSIIGYSLNVQTGMERPVPASAYYEVWWKN
jgi:hypothetical protein